MDKADISAQVEVQRLQIQILIETVQEKEKEIEKEKQLIEECKLDANSRVAIETDPDLQDAISRADEFKVMEEMHSQVVNQNRELLLLLLQEKARLEQFKEKSQRGNAKQEFFRVKKELEGKTKLGFNEMKAEQQSVDLLRQELEMKEQEVLALKEEKNRMMNEWPDLQDEVEKLSEEHFALREYTEGIRFSLQQEVARTHQLKNKEDPPKDDQAQSSFFGSFNSGLYNSWSSISSINTFSINDTISSLTSLGVEEGSPSGVNGTAGSQPSTPGPVTPSSPKSRQEGSDVNTGIEEANPEGPSSKQGEIGLPIGQTCLQYFSCCNADLKGGWFYVCEECVVFEATLKQHEIEGPVVIPFEGITQIDKRNMAVKHIPGKGRSICIHTSTKEFLFRSFLQRDAAASLLLEQCKALGHSVLTTNENEPDDFSV